VLGVIIGDGRGHAEVNAQVGTGSGWTGETALIRLRGEVTKHPESVVLPLLLPDSPVACWWPAEPPADPAADPLGALAQRRITDSAGAQRSGPRVIHQQCSVYAKGNTDLAWTRITPWRALLAAALDQYPAAVTSAQLEAEKNNPSADLLAAWLHTRLKVEIKRSLSSGPGITAVRMSTNSGEIAITRPDGLLASYVVPGQPERRVALKRRDSTELIAEELRRMDADLVYEETIKALANGG
jgi:glucose-6-phosphate dehydrogenase assembly protein OpcA